MTYLEFKEAIAELPIKRQTFLTILFFAGVRVSEALAITPQDINCKDDIIYIDIHRLKGSKDTDPIPLPAEPLYWLRSLTGLPKDYQIFDFSRTTAWRIVKQIWPNKYPHYFRQNRFTDIAEKFPLATIMNFSGLSPSAVQFYIAKVDIRKVGQALREELI